ncbi:MAG: acetylglutamate kinase [Chloroflexi bacterium RBG_13_56_8]|nr:MAG: acetylglutamate kinase [Chloroflexi bacterium RBG_13_56_8]
MDNNTLTLIKIGGAELADQPVLAELVDALVQLARQRTLIIVHGGGPEIAQLQKRLGLVPRFVEGLRVTDEESLWVAEMVLSGAVNKRLTARLVNKGIKAIGISGVDGGLLQAKKMAHPAGDLGYVGEITQVNTSCLEDLLRGGFTPVISPISLGENGRPYNVNADHAALAIAAALRVEEAIFLTDVPGVMHGGIVLEEISAQRARHLIDTGHITGGMIPKVNSALDAIEGGVHSARITDLASLVVGSGTRVVA